jgi:DNA polymerase
MFHDLPEWKIKQAEDAIADVLTRDLDHVVRIWGDPVALLCGCLRALFIAKPGHDFVCSDFSAIEAVVAACLSRCQWRIDVFNGTQSIYLMSASKITGTPVEVYEQYKIDNKAHHPDRGKIGKVAELASGFGGWINAWKNFGASDSDDKIKADILKWREESPEIVDMWGAQFRWCGPGKWDYRPELFGLEGCAIQAVMFPGQYFRHIDIAYYYNTAADVLQCWLPSGRALNYHRPRLEPAEDKLHRGPAVSLTFEGHNSNSMKGPVGWQRMETFGGRLFENVVQAVARDIQALGLLRIESRGYPVVMHTHDEGCTEVPEGFGSVEELDSILAERPPWAAWWPIKAAGWRHKRYQKD